MANLAGLRSLVQLDTNINKPNISGLAGLRSIATTNSSVPPSIPKTQEKTNVGGVTGGAGYLLGNLGAGAFGVLEGIYDYVVGGVAKATGNESYARKLMEDDISGRWSQNLNEWYNPSKGMEFAGNVASGIGQSLVGVGASVGIGALTGGAGVPLIAGLTIGLGAAGKSTAEAYRKTGELGGREFLYGGISGGIEAGLETLTGVAGKVGKSIVSPFAKTTAKSAVRQGIARTMISNGAGEFIEEALSEIIDPYLQRGLGIDKEAQNAKIEEILYSGMVGFVSGAALGGGSTAITNAGKTKVGTKVIENGQAENVVNNSVKMVSEATETDNKKIREQAESLQATLNAYNGLADKSTTRAKMLLGELSQGLAITQTAIGVEKSKAEIVKNAEVIADILQQNGENVTAEDIRENKKKVADKLAAKEYAARMVMADNTLNSLVSEGKTLIGRKSYEGLKNTLSDRDIQDINTKLGIDLRTADYDGFVEAMKAYKGKALQEGADIPVNAQTEQAKIQPQAIQAAQAMPQGLQQAQHAAQQAPTDQRSVIRQAVADKAVSVKTIEQINALAKSKNIAVKYYYDTSDTASYGHYSNNTLTINLASKEGAYYTAVHEYAHHLEKYAPHLLNDYLNQVDKLIEMSPKFKAEAEQWREIYRNDPRTANMSEAELRNEIAFKITKQLIDNPSEFNSIVTQNMTVAQKIKLWLRNFLNRLMKTNFTAEQQAVRKALTALESAIKEGGITSGEYVTKTANEKSETAIKEGSKATNTDNKPKHSLPDTDSKGRKLTEAQREFFKDSKVVDEKGRLLEVYHGTNEDFNVFSQRGTDNKYGKGFYFSEYKGFARLYGDKLLSVYLDIKKPIVVGKGDYKKLGKYGYDGIIQYKNGKIAEAVVLNPNQIKLTTNLNPTENEDIRYSLTDINGKKLTEAQLSDPYTMTSTTNNLGENLSVGQVLHHKDSKVRDEKGRLLEVYHGTTANEFTVFNKEYVGSRFLNDEVGFFFTESKTVAEDYTTSAWGRDRQKRGHLFSVYLNFVKPLIVRASIDSDISGDAIAHYDLNNAKLIERATKGGYDSIIVKSREKDIADLYVAFEPSQIKLTTNLNPTENEDIRYSLKDTKPYKADVITNVYEEVNGKKTLARKEFKGAEIREYNGKYYIKTADGKVITRSIGTTTYVMNGTAETSRDMVKTSVAPEITLKERMSRQNIKRGWNDLYMGFQIAFVNEQAALEKEMKRLGAKGYDASVQYARAARSAAEQMLFTAQYSFDGQKVGESLSDILKPVIKDENTKQDFFHYLFAKHHIDRMKYGKPVLNITSEEAQKVVDKYEQNKVFVDTANKVYKYLDNLLQYQVDTGMVSQETADDLRKIYPHYVPTFRDVVGARLGTGSMKGKYNLAVNSILKTATGSDLDLLPLDITIGAMTIKTIKAARVNMVAKQLYDAAKAQNDFTNIEITSEIAEDKDARDIDPDEHIPKNNEVTFFENGKRITMKVNRQIFVGFEAFAPVDPAYSKLEAAVRSANNLFKRLVTSLNPAFMIRNPVRDLQDAGLYSKYLKSFPKNYLRAITEVQRNGELWQQYKAAGGFGVSLFDHAQGFKGRLNKYGLSKSETNILGKALEGIENANLVIEQLPRFAEYISSIEAGNSVQQALLDSADITVNFGRKGRIGKRLNATIMPFLNPAIQGLSKMIRTVTSAKTARAWAGLLTKALVLGVLPQLLNMLMYKDDEDYKLLHDRDKENNYLFKVGDKFIKLPKGRVLSIFAGLTMRTVQATEGEKPDMKGYIENVMTQATPVENFSRTIFSPFQDVANNLTWYGTAIEGRQFENVEPKQRYDEGTSSIAIAMGKALNYSPKKIHYLLDQYSGVIGDFLLPATTKKAEKDFLSGNFSIDPALSNKLSNSFYNAYDKAQYAKTNGDETAALQVRYMNRVKDAVNELYKQKREIENSDISDKEKRAETKAIQILINEIYKTALTDLPLLNNAFGATDSIDDANIRYVESLRLTYGAERALREYNAAVYEKAQKLNSAKIDYDTYYNAYFTLKGVESQKDKAGNTIPGSKKAATIRYINTLNLKLDQKMLLLYANGYAVQDNDFYGYSKAQAQTAVANYIARLPISLDEKKALAEVCGFEVKNGKVVIK